MKTAVQQVFSELEELHPNLFNINTTEGKEFVHHFHKYIAMEKEQIIRAYSEGQNTPYEYSEDNEINWYDGPQYYKETYESKTNI